LTQECSYSIMVNACINNVFLLLYLLVNSPAYTERNTSNLHHKHHVLDDSKNQALATVTIKHKAVYCSDIRHGKILNMMTLSQICCCLVSWWIILKMSHQLAKLAPFWTHCRQRSGFYCAILYHSTNKLWCHDFFLQTLCSYKQQIMQTFYNIQQFTCSIYLQTPHLWQLKQ